MPTKDKKNQCFHEYFAEWMELYKEGGVRPVTYQKYQMTLQRLSELAPTLTVSELDRRSYQKLINEYAKTHERKTTMDFHHQLKGAILDALYEGLLEMDPTRKVIIKGKLPNAKKTKFLSQHELTALLAQLKLSKALNWDWLILLVAKTGMRFAEALALTPSDFDFAEQKIRINKTWNYKSVDGGFAETKNTSSRRTLQVDKLLNSQFKKLVKGLPEDKPIFVKGRVFNSTINSRLKTLCKAADVPVISIHSLRHSHASVLLFAGVSTASIAKRLGHSSVTTTQETYLHIIKELENKDTHKIMKHLSDLHKIAPED